MLDPAINLLRISTPYMTVRFHDAKLFSIFNVEMLLSQNQPDMFLQACVRIELNWKTIAALQLDVTPGSVANSLLTSTKLKLKFNQVRWAAEGKRQSISCNRCIVCLAVAHLPSTNPLGSAFL